MKHAFDSGYRRVEWKCDSLHAVSRQAAIRNGFTYEATLRQSIVYKGRNRDTSYYSMLDREWSQLKLAFEGWLRPCNFDKDGRQIK